MAQTERCGFFLAPDHQCPDAATHVSQTSAGRVFACQDCALRVAHQGWPTIWQPIGGWRSPIGKASSCATERSPPEVLDV